MKYENMVKIIADSNRSQFERGDILIREMNRLSTDILDYRYAAEHYGDKGTVLEDKRNQIKNSLVLVKSDLDIYIEQLGFAEIIANKSEKRLSKMVDRI